MEDKATKNSIEVHSHNFRISVNSPIKEKALRSLCTVEFDMMIYISSSHTVTLPQVFPWLHRRRISGCPSSLADPGGRIMGQICRKDGGDWLIERVEREKHLKTALDWVWAMHGLGCSKLSVAGL